MHISQFSQDTQDFIYQLCFKAITRAIQNGTYPVNKAECSMECNTDNNVDNDLSPAI